MAREQIRVGGLYAVRDEDGTWRVMKVLAMYEYAVHLRWYTNVFRQQPKDVDPKVLTFGIGHMPLAKEGFLRDHPVLIKVVPVVEEELDGYRLYLEAMGGE